MTDRFWDAQKRYTEGQVGDFNHWVLEMSYRQHTLGSFIVFAKRPFEQFSDLDLDEFRELRAILRTMEDALSAVFRPDRFNYLQLGNNWHQLHLHGVPCYATPRIFEGKEWIDASFGKPPLFTDKEADAAFIRHLRDEIKKTLRG